jgi:hypothetical protein
VNETGRTEERIPKQAKGREAVVAAVINQLREGGQKEVEEEDERSNTQFGNIRFSDRRPYLCYCCHNMPS